MSSRRQRASASDYDIRAARRMARGGFGPIGVYQPRRIDGQFQVLSAICPHMGCSVSWQTDHDDLYAHVTAVTSKLTEKHIRGHLRAPWISFRPGQGRQAAGAIPVFPFERTQPGIVELRVKNVKSSRKTGK